LIIADFPSPLLIAATFAGLADRIFTLAYVDAALTVFAGGCLEPATSFFAALSETLFIATNGTGDTDRILAFTVLAELTGSAGEIDEASKTTDL